MKINKKFIKENFEKRNNTKKYIVIHDTANTSKGAGAYNHYKYFNSAYRGASAHVFVDSKQILQVVKFDDISWHCGDGHGKNGIWNSNSIGVEICINSDGDYSKTLIKTIDLVIYLMKTYKIDINHVVRHFDASGKICPRGMSRNDWSGWKHFMNRVKNKLNEVPVPKKSIITKIIEKIKPKKITIYTELSAFIDFKDVADYAKPSVSKLEELKIFRGETRGKFNPKGYITRQDLAIVIDRVITYLKEN